ncbi:MAG: sel1 repeat family protein [Elusimicrobia bacterium]|nr:sel1 repeat family protein [Elusimicrobiota bacterium]MBK8422913.1 sel1 repeat family protein [Elusimicrobiota bacterium]MBK9057346.1 sel1 repeat family protein [Elusimicrobiota bacterium]MBK9428919.1 sel1 repeat family protein [Elusimicrobiota bacterium]MBL0360116.1 sel1 repeat family protein [Elusimicrobiota bacterium]
MAILYAKGHGLTKNPQESACWLIKAAQSGIPQAQPLLAMFYLLGRGVPRHIPLGIKWLAKWARQTFLPTCPPW